MNSRNVSVSTCAVSPQLANPRLTPNSISVAFMNCEQP